MAIAKVMHQEARGRIKLMKVRLVRSTHLVRCRGHPNFYGLLINGEVSARRWLVLLAILSS